MDQTDVVMDWSQFTVVEATDPDTNALLSLRDDTARWLLDRGIDQDGNRARSPSPGSGVMSTLSLYFGAERIG